LDGARYPPKKEAAQQDKRLSNSPEKSQIFRIAGLFI